MATIHLVKDGKRGDGTRLTHSVSISMADAIAQFGTFGTKYSAQPPTINPETPASDFAPYKHVVLEVEGADAKEPFATPGYYYIIGAAPADCQRLLGISAPDV